jgi:hypothetical protein
MPRWSRIARRLPVYFHVHFERFASNATKDELMYRKISGEETKALPALLNKVGVLAGYKEKEQSNPVTVTIPGFEKK